tara:strand:+ start:265 stop:1131 length:867 start_codon:yes stop_codon:yes gene_type:complete
MTSAATAPTSSDPPALRFKFVSVNDTGTAMVSAIEAQAATTTSSVTTTSEVRMAQLTLVSFGLSSDCGAPPSNCVRTINCALLDALVSQQPGTASTAGTPSIDALCSFLVCELQGLVVARSPASAPVSPCFSPPLSPGCSPSAGTPLSSSSSCASTPPTPRQMLPPQQLPMQTAPHAASLLAPVEPQPRSSSLLPGLVPGTMPMEGAATSPRGGGGGIAPQATSPGAGGGGGRRGSGGAPVMRVAIGCADGLGASVRVVDHLAAQLEARGVSVSVRHRELRRAQRRAA